MIDDNTITYIESTKTAGCQTCPSHCSRTAMRRNTMVTIHAETANSAIGATYTPKRLISENGTTVSCIRQPPRLPDLLTPDDTQHAHSGLDLLYLVYTGGSVDVMSADDSRPPVSVHYA